METLEVLQFITSSFGVFALGGIVRLIAWKSRVDSKLDQFTERFDGAGNRKGLFARLDDIEQELRESRRAGEREHAAIRNEMQEAFRATDSLVDGVSGSVGKLRHELRIRKLIGDEADQDK